jgi:hypothetical protein
MSRITINLPEWTPADLVISGEISRMDIEPSGGYAAWLFRNNDVQDWQRELRMPLIQETLAHEMGVPLEGVIVGVYGFRRRVVQHRTYSVGEVRLAYSSLGDLLRQLGF